MMSIISKQERLVAINPTRSCAPIGAMLSTFGVHGALTINHGSQGCATYPRHQMARHFREPIEVATSSLTEKTTVYGGKENLLAAIKNVYERFKPTMITICSTCLSETIGDDVPAIIEEFQKHYPDVAIPILSVRTPSYIGTHITGFDNFLTEVANQLPIRQPKKKDAPTNGKVNLIPGWVNPGDIRELRAMLAEMDVEATLITDFSETLDGGYYHPRPRFPRGGTTVEELRDSSNAMATIALQQNIGGTAAGVYKRRHNVPAHVLPMPVGLANTDTFIETLTAITGKPMPISLELERARLLDAIVDTHMFNTGKRAAVYGDPDMVYGLVRLLAEMGIQPAFALTAHDSKKWAEDMLALANEIGVEVEIMYRSDLHELHKRIRAAPVDIVLGHSKGKFISDAEEVPLVRVGFPIEDRVGYHRRTIVGYRGAISLVDEITNAILSNKMVVSSTVMERTMMGPTSIPLEIEELSPRVAAAG
ncbi:MAG: nitrogenase [Chloroflexaceae bacterium]|nr:nitrogenase [Chloroflexaceae bacterium]